jgi:hypothetical protein
LYLFRKKSELDYQDVESRFKAVRGSMRGRLWERAKLKGRDKQRSWAVLLSLAE